MKERLIPILEAGICGLALYGLSFLAVPKPSKKQIEEAEKYGGSDIEDWQKYTQSDNIPSYDKGGHKERSIVNDPKHLDHWKDYGKK